MNIINACFSNDGRHCTICIKDKVIIYDVSNKDTFIPIITAELPEISGAIFYENELYFSTNKSNIIYHLQNNKPIPAKDLNGIVELISQVKNSDKWIISINRALCVYDLKQSQILYELPIHSSFKDYAIYDANNIGILIATEARDISVYEGDDDSFYVEMAICDSKSGKLIDALGTTVIEDSWEGYTCCYPREGATYKWPLLQYSNYIPSPLACVDNTKNVLYSGNGYYYIADAVTGKLVRIMDKKMIIKEAYATFIDSEMKYLTIALKDRLQTYQISDMPQEELDDLNKIYPALNRMDRYGGSEKRAYNEKFNRLRYRYGDLNLINELYYSQSS